jgi:hypothetical protein
MLLIPITVLSVRFQCVGKIDKWSIWEAVIAFEAISLEDEEVKQCGVLPAFSD